MDKNFLDLYKEVMNKTEEYESDDIEVVFEFHPRKQFINDLVKIKVINWENDKRAVTELDMESFEQCVYLKEPKIEDRMLNHILEGLLLEVTK